jgi:hypothetical protein
MVSCPEAEAGKDDHAGDDAFRLCNWLNVGTSRSHLRERPVDALPSRNVLDRRERYAAYQDDEDGQKS